MITTLLFALSLSPARAKEVVITDQRCVKAGLAQAHEAITDYNAYSRVPGARYELKIASVGIIPLLTMVKSQGRFATRTADRTDGYAWVVLQPVNLVDAKYYPKMLLHCESSFDSPTRFTHHCALEQDKLHYGLRDFRSVLEAVAGSPLCEAGETRLDYRLTLDSSPEEVEAIKREVTRPLGAVVAPLVANLFVEDSFFRAYYLNFYSSWAKQLQ